MPPLGENVGGTRLPWVLLSLTSGDKKIKELNFMTKDIVSCKS